MFRGSFVHTVDEKGRAAIPVKWRGLFCDEHDQRLVLTRSMVKGARCVDAYPFTQWTRLEAKLGEQDEFGERSMWVQFYLAGAYDCSMDKQGRILIPPQLRDYADLRKEVVFAGILSKFRLWNVDVWQRVDSEVEQKMIDDPGFLASLRI